MDQTVNTNQEKNGALKDQSQTPGVQPVVGRAARVRQGQIAAKQTKQQQPDQELEKGQSDTDEPDLGQDQQTEEVTASEETEEAINFEELKRAINADDIAAMTKILTDPKVQELADKFSLQIGTAISDCYLKTTEAAAAIPDRLGDIAELLKKIIELMSMELVFATGHKMNELKRQFKESLN